MHSTGNIASILFTFPLKSLSVFMMSFANVMILIVLGMLL